MAQTKKKMTKNIKTAKKVVKKVQKSSKGTKVFFGILLVIVLGVLIFGGYEYYSIVITTNNDISALSNKLQENITSKVTNSIDLITTDADYPNITINWDSSDTSIINPLTNLVNQPSFIQGDKEVVLTAVFEYHNPNDFANKVYNLFSQTKQKLTLNITVVAREATNQEKITLVGASLFVPEATYTSIGLPTSSTVFDDVSIAWSSSNALLSDDGSLTSPLEDTNCILTATVTAGGLNQNFNFPILLLKNDFTINEVDETFNDNPTNNSYATISDDGITYTQAKVQTHDDFTPSTDSAETGEEAENYLRIRFSLDSAATITTGLIQNPKTLSFKYRYPSLSTNHATDAAYFDIKIYTSDDDTVGTPLDPITIAHSTDDVFCPITIDLSSYQMAKVVITVVYGWGGSDDDFVDIEDLIITRALDDDDFINWLTNNISTTISQSMVLPLTTYYGGIINWSSSDETILSNNGKLLTTITEASTLTMQAEIIYGTSKTITVTIDIKLKGASNVTPVEIYFIDLGKYGASDCGEATHIKFGTIDILVDAGDAFATSKQAVEEALNTQMDDKIIEYVIATHPDADHIGGMPNVFEKYTITNLYTFNGEHTSQKYRNYVTAYTNEECNVYNVYDITHGNDNDRFLYLDNDVYLEFIDTSYYGLDVTETNGRSIVFVLNAYGTRLLMTGDADNGSGHTDLEEKYMASVGNIDILKAVHHGTAAGTTTEFLNKVDPEVVIVCNGNYLGNKHGHPHSDAINNIYQYDDNITIYAICGGGANGGNLSTSNSYTTNSNGDERFIDRNGTIVLSIDSNGYTITSEYYEDEPLEFSSTTFWKQHPLKEFTYMNN